MPKALVPTRGQMSPLETGPGRQVHMGVWGYTHPNGPARSQGAGAVPGPGLTAWVRPSLPGPGLGNPFLEQKRAKQGHVFQKFFY